MSVIVFTSLFVQVTLASSHSHTQPETISESQPQPHSLVHFTDQSLQRLLQNSEENQTSGVIWVWSPRMNLSIYGLSELKPIAALLNLELTVLVDPHHPEILIYNKNFESLLKDSQIMSSQVLEKWGALIHYPVLIIYKNGKILLPNRPGYDEPERLYRYLARRLL